MALTLGDNFSYQGAKPLDARLNYSTLAAMKAVADATMYNGCMAYCSETEKTYQWKSANTVDETLGKWREFSSGGGGGGGTEYTAGDGIDITEDVISTKKSETGDIDEIIDKYPKAGELVSIANAFNKGDLYSTTERMIGQWIDGKPLYQKTIALTDALTLTPNTDSRRSIVLEDHGLSNIEIVDVKGMDYFTNSGSSYCMPFGNSDPTGQRMPTLFHCVEGITSTAISIVYNATYSPTVTKTVITIQYTKTTDQVVSIGEANEYSTSEKIIGTWIDGRPIYQRTYEQEINLAPDTWVASSLVATNVNKVINGIGYNAGSSIDCLLSGVVNGYFGFNSTRSQSVIINAFTVQYTKTT